MILFILCVTVVPVLAGLACMRLKREKETMTLTEAYMMGLLVLFLLGEVAACLVIKLDGSFSFYCKILSGAVIVWCLLSVLLGWKMGKELLRHVPVFFRLREGTRHPRRRIVEWAVLIALIAVQAGGYFLFVPETGSDTMAETIGVTLMSDTVFQYNPVTGMALEYGMYPIYKLASLPLLYSSLCRLCGLPLQTFLFFLLPFWMILINLGVMSVWSNILIEESVGEYKEKRRLFLIFISLLIVMGDSEKTSFAWLLLHSGWRGTTAVAAFVIPFGVYIAYTMFQKKEWIFGSVGIFLSLCGFVFTRPLRLPESFAFTGQDTGRQWGMLLLVVIGLYLAREKAKKRWKLQEAVFLGMCLMLSLISGSTFAYLGVGYVMTCLWGIAEERKKGTSLFVGFFIAICMAGTVLPFHGNALKKWHVSEADLEIQDKITQYAGNYEGTVMLVAPEHVMEQARLQNDNIILPYGKDLWYGFTWYGKKSCNQEIADVYTEKEVMLYEQMKVDYKQPDTMAALVSETDCRLLVLREEMSEEAKAQYGWHMAEKTEGYAIYYK